MCKYTSISIRCIHASITRPQSYTCSHPTNQKSYRILFPKSTGRPNISGWWLNHPFEKYPRQLGSFPQGGVKITNIWNHHPDLHCFKIHCSCSLSCRYTSKVISGQICRWKGCQFFRTAWRWNSDRPQLICFLRFLLPETYSSHLPGSFTKESADFESMKRQSENETNFTPQKNSKALTLLKQKKCNLRGVCCLNSSNGPVEKN